MAAKYSFLVIKYPSPDTGMDALKALYGLVDDKVVKLRDAVAITKTPKGKIKLHQTKDDSVGGGFVKGGLIGILFAGLFGPVGWIALGAAAGGVFAGFDRGIKNKLLKELGGDLTPDESAVAILVEQADWQTAFERMKAHGFGGRLVLSEIVPDDLAEVERLLEDPATVESVPEEIEMPAAAPAAIAAAAAPAAVAAVATSTATPVAHAAAAMRVAEVEGIGSADAEKLIAIGIKTTDDLLQAGAKPSGRDQVARSTGISGDSILGWVNDADLMRIPGVGPEYSDLLEAAGVDSPAELVLRNPKNLEITFQEVAAARPGIVRRVPGESEIRGWMDAASKLDKIVEH
jgi:uncharacterized membrane protein